MRIPFRRSTRRARGVGRRWSSRWPRRMRSGAGFALQENNASGLGNAYAGGAAIAEDASTVWWNPAGMSRLKQREAVQAHPLHHPVEQVQQRRLAAGAQPAARQQRRRRRRPQRRPEPVRRRARQPAAGVRARRQRAVRPDDRVRRRLDRPLPRAQVAGEDDQRQPGGVVEGQRPVLAWASASTSSGSTRRSPATRTTRRRSRRARSRRAAAGPIPAAAMPPILAATRGLDSRSTVKGDDTAWGWNIGALYEFNAEHARRRALPLGDQVRRRGDVDFNNPALPALPPALAPTVAAIVKRRQPRALNGDVHVRHRAAADRQPVVLPRLNDRWDIMADAQWTGWSTHQGPDVHPQRRPGAADDAARISTTCGASRSARTTA